MTTRTGSAVAILLLLLAACATRQTGPSTYVAPAGPGSLECARSVLESRGWEVQRRRGSQPGLEAQLRETADERLTAMDVILISIRRADEGREMEAQPRSYVFGRGTPATAEPEEGREVEPPERVSQLAALAVATCREGEVETPASAAP